jgi:hypothetical protein
LKQYYFLQNNQQIGPLRIELLLAHNLGASTLIWCEGMPDWQPISTLAEYRAKSGYAQASSGYAPTPAATNPNYYDPNNPYLDEPVKDWTVPLIILLVVSLCTCVGAILPGIGLIYSQQSKGSLRFGNRVGALKNANIAGILFKIGLVLTLSIFAVRFFMIIHQYNKTGSFNPYTRGSYYNIDDDEDDDDDLFD